MPIIERGDPIIRAGNQDVGQNRSRASFRLSRRLRGALILFVLLTVVGAAHSLWTIHVMHENRRAVEIAARASQHFERMFERAEHYQSIAPREWQDFFRDVQIYFSSLRDDIDTMDRLVAELAQRVSGSSSAVWNQFRDGLEEQIGDEPERPRLEWASKFITEQSSTLAAELQEAKERVASIALRSRHRMWVSSVLLALATLSLSLMVAWIFRYQVLRRIEETSHAVRRISDGQFDNISSKRAEDELGQLEDDVRELSRRNQDLVDLLDILNGARSLNEAIDRMPRPIIRRFRLAWIGLIKVHEDIAQLRFSYPEDSFFDIEERKVGWPLEDSFLGRVHQSKRTICEKLDSSALAMRDPLLHQLHDAGYSSIALLPVLQKEQVEGCIVLASHSQQAFEGWQGRWLGNVGHLLAHAMYRSFAHEEVERVSQAKSEFLSRMSHELRTPMNAILGFGQLMEFDNSLPDQHRDNVREILKAGNHLLELINEVLDLARIESGRIELSAVSVALCPLIAECIKLIDPMTEKRNIGIYHQCPDGIRVQADPTRLKQALLNLLSNAVKYNREGGSVRIEVRCADDERLRILVSDTGWGIPEDKLAGVFQPFNRLGADDHNIEGSGIGLSITRRVVELMGGTVDVESDVGRGSTFWIELPMKAGDEVDDNNPELLPTSEHADTDRSGSQVVLYIEDNPANLRLVSQILGRMSHIRLLNARTPELGMELARVHRPALILLDINLPGMNGYQVLKELRSETCLKDTPVIAVTANAMPGEVERGSVAGFVEYVTKPLDVQQFLATVNRWLAGDGDKQAG